MNNRQIISLGLKPTQAWLPILTLVFFTILCILVHFSKILLLAFPVGSFAVAVFLYLRHPIFYVSFTWWVWFLSPLLSRIVEYQNNLTTPGLRLIILSPYLVTMLTSISFFRYLPKVYRQDGLPFFLAFIGLLYAFLIGLVNGNPVVGVIQTLMSWLPAIFFGFHLSVNWPDYPSYRQNIQRTFCWGVLVMGVYGVVQYLVAPEWDRFWLRNSKELLLCCGWPEPLMIRVWSTLNYPFGFAYVMMASLLLLLSNQGALRVPAAIAGYLAFLLSVVRAAWGGWLVGFVFFFTAIKAHFQVRLLIIILIISICIYPLTTIPPFSAVIGSRFQSLSNVKEDRSFNERSEIYTQNIDKAVSEVIGRGLGGEKLNDAGILEVLFTLGWFGFIPYMGGVFLLLFSLFQYTEVRFDNFMNAARAGSLSILVTLPATNTLILLPGVTFWGFAGMVMAAHKYYQHQRTK